MRYRRIAPRGRHIPSTSQSRNLALSNIENTDWNTLAKLQNHKNPSYAEMAAKGTPQENNHPLDLSVRIEDPVKEVSTQMVGAAASNPPPNSWVTIKKGKKTTLLSAAQSSLLGLKTYNPEELMIHNKPGGDSNIRSVQLTEQQAADLGLQHPVTAKSVDTPLQEIDNLVIDERKNQQQTNEKQVPKLRINLNLTGSKPLKKKKSKSVNKVAKQLWKK